MRTGLLVSSLVTSGVVIALGCSGGGDGGGSTSSGGAGSTSGGSSSGSSGDEDECLLRISFSGGVNGSLGDESQACAYTSRAATFAPLGGKLSALLAVRDVEPLQKGIFPASLELHSDGETWSGAACTVDIERNEKVAAASDAGGVSFDQYVIAGKGSCTTSAVYRGEAGAKDPVTIAPFTFVMRTLFY